MVNGIMAGMEMGNIGTMKDIMVIMTTDIIGRHSKKPHFLRNAASFTPNITRFAEA